MDQILEFLAAHAWVGWLIFGVLSLALSRQSQIDAWVEQHPRIAGMMKLLRALGLDPWMAAQALSLLIRGRLPIKLQAQKLVAEKDAPPPSREVLAEARKQSEPPPPPKPPSVPHIAATLMLCIALAAFMFGACGGPQKPTTTTPPECSEEHLAKIEAAYIAEAAEACAGSTYDECGVLEEIRRKYQAKRDAWKGCQ